MSAPSWIDWAAFLQWLADRDLLRDAEMRQAVAQFLEAYTALEGAITTAQSARILEYAAGGPHRRP